jgi:phosphoenolpyruvate synthase/pyruvate phosphate dikinase
MGRVRDVGAVRDDHGIGVDTIDDVVTAASRVLASGKTARVAAYRADLDAAEGRLAVLVQRLVAAEAAGVLFTKNPVTGDDELVLEAVRGLGDRLVDGAAEAERWIQRLQAVRSSYCRLVRSPDCRAARRSRSRRAAG